MVEDAEHSHVFSSKGPEVPLKEKRGEGREIQQTNAGLKVQAELRPQLGPGMSITHKESFGKHRELNGGSCSSVPPYAPRCKPSDDLIASMHPLLPLQRLAQRRAVIEERAGEEEEDCKYVRDLTCLQVELPSFHCLRY
ncbi:hypothetical protein OPV22_004399 [Ensete ventricosum]|uniref:Uncharacterized protein n=1 Tax=Ensete ventricosum TaxID=4639 RepID=A0AAV8S3M9_ENSVE|nr:hypothetical protein OPV22_004399 [Ensete ventricosum]